MTPVDTPVIIFYALSAVILADFLLAAILYMKGSQFLQNAGKTQASVTGFNENSKHLELTFKDSLNRDIKVLTGRGDIISAVARSYIKNTDVSPKDIFNWRNSAQKLIGTSIAILYDRNNPQTIRSANAPVLLLPVAIFSSCLMLAAVLAILVHNHVAQLPF